jgi:hypothetical protein
LSATSRRSGSPGTCRIEVALDPRQGPDICRLPTTNPTRQPAMSTLRHR